MKKKLRQKCENLEKLTKCGDFKIWKSLPNWGIWKLRMKRVTTFEFFFCWDSGKVGEFENFLGEIDENWK